MFTARNYANAAETINVALSRGTSDVATRNALMRLSAELADAGAHLTYEAGSGLHLDVLITRTQDNRAEQSIAYIRGNDGTRYSADPELVDFLDEVRDLTVEYSAAVSEGPSVDDLLTTIRGSGPGWTAALDELADRARQADQS